MMSGGGWMVGWLVVRPEDVLMMKGPKKENDLQIFKEKKFDSNEKKSLKVSISESFRIDGCCV